MLKRLSLISLILILLSACNLGLRSLNPEKLIGDPDNLSHLRMLDGNTGEIIVFAPGEDMQTVLNFIKSLEGTFDPELGISAGYQYWLAGYRDGEEVFRLTFGSSIVKIDGKRYTLDRDVSSELETLFSMAPYGNLLSQAMSDLAREHNVDVNEIKPISVEAYIFPDASLGVPEEGMAYAQVETAGYILILSLEDEIVTYHGAGDRLVQVPK